MPILQFKGKTAVENYHHTVPHHSLEFDSKLSCLGKGEEPNLDGNLIVEGDNLLALKALLPTHAGRIKCGLTLGKRIFLESGRVLDVSGKQSFVQGMGPNKGGDVS